MRDSKRIKHLIKKLYRVWLEYPDLRLGQLIMAIPHISGLKISTDLYYIEDDLMETLLDYINGDSNDTYSD